MMSSLSVIEDTRKVLQDFVAPELRAIDIRLTTLEKRLEESISRSDRRFDEMQKRADQRFDQVKARTDQQFSSLEQKMDLRFEQVDVRFQQVLAEIKALNTVHDLELRMAKYEAFGTAMQANAPKAESEAA